MAGYRPESRRVAKSVAHITLYLPHPCLHYILFTFATVQYLVNGLDMFVFFVGGGASKMGLRMKSYIILSGTEMFSLSLTEVVCVCVCVLLTSEVCPMKQV